MEIRRINDRLSVSPQISVDDVAAVKAAGFVAIVNNRPDGEEDDQTDNAIIEAEARRLGLDFYFIPVTAPPFDPEMIRATQQVLDNAKGPVFFYCRTGTRCTNLWAISQAGRQPADELIKAAAGAGYNISHLAGQLGGG
ncbi:MAG TPA: TIGR01244 family phosphatase [Devosia sp.]|nr:TIGR01244 family phosphatase [Devosia sp.]